MFISLLQMMIHLQGTAFCMNQDDDVKKHKQYPEVPNPRCFAGSQVPLMIEERKRLMQQCTAFGFENITNIIIPGLTPIDTV